MSKKQVVEFDEQCPDCNGTGLYVGMLERDGAAVVCYRCQGTGCYHFRHVYKEFVARRDRSDVKRVFEANMGICIGTKHGVIGLESFGGIPYKDWKQGKPFLPGMEMRRFICPCYWFQNTDYDKKPEWKECNSSLGFGFRRCASFQSKEKCWERWDKESTNEHARG